MYRGIMLSISMLLAGGAQAHVSDASAAGHAAEHLWLLLLVPPLVWFLARLARTGRR